MIHNPIPWPDNARCAVAFTFDMDAEALLHINFHDETPDRVAMASMLRYEPQVAVPRILEIFRRFELRQTFFIPGWCVEAYPASMEQILAAGHELGHHGYLHKRPNAQSRDEEADSLGRGIEALAKLSGHRPAGYRAPAYAFSRHTLELLQESGFRYDSSLLGDDQPYLIGNARGDLVELPTDMSLDDWTQYVCNKELGYMLPIASPARAMEVFRAEFDAAWSHGGLWNAVWHPFVSGRPSRADAFAGLIEYMQDKGGVWFATLAEIAAHVREVSEKGLWRPRLDEVPYWPEPLQDRELS